MRGILKIVIIALLMQFPLISHSQRNTNTSSSQIDWVKYHETENFKIDHRTIQVTDPDSGENVELVIFRYTNKTAQPLSIYFNREAIYVNGCTDCDEAFQEISVTLEPLEIISYDESHRDNPFFLYSRDLNQSVNKILTSYLLTEYRTNLD